MDTLNGYRVSGFEAFLVIGLLAVWSFSAMVVIGMHNGLAA